MIHTVEVDLDGRKITLETGKVAKQANGAVVVRSGDSVVLVSACMANDPKPGAGFFPLTVDYREYTYAAGKIPGGFIKREGRLSEKKFSPAPDRSSGPAAVSRRVPVRNPDHRHGPFGGSRAGSNSLAIVGAAAALAISDIPFPYVLAGVRVGMKTASPGQRHYTEGRESS